MALTAALGVRAGRQLTTSHALAPGQQQLTTALGLTPDTNPPRPRRTFTQLRRRLDHENTDPVVLA
ncbi:MULTISPECIES: hypothetical protein [unclassified Streptomyces]|uniref:hypothetical protein n=1 Tax=unclassified Streptomyces TaxID=2593676 RepID=UPI000AC387AC|nr:MULTISPECIES: hypothetical protein [unclassified Streptomyces]